MTDNHEKSYSVSTFVRNGRICKKYFFPVGEHIIDAPIELDDFDILEGESIHATLLKVYGSFAGPVIRSKRLKQHCENVPWLHDEGVPVRFSIKNLTIDLQDWQPVEEEYDFEYGTLSKSAIGLYGKAFDVDKVSIINAPGSGLISIGPNTGGKKDYYLDSPEAKITSLEITNTKDDGLIFAGPHDSVLDNIIVSISKKRGVFVIADQKINGACDIGFIHAYGTNSTAIHIHAKVKARFLQGDAGKTHGVLIGGSNKSIIEVIEAFKTRKSNDDKPSYSVEVTAVETQIGIVRIRADAGADGLLLSGFGNTISNLHIVAGAAHSGFKHLNIETPPAPITLDGHANSIGFGRIVDARRQIIEVRKEGIEKHFTATLSVDFSNFPAGVPYYNKNSFCSSVISINNDECRID